MNHTEEICVFITLSFSFSAVHKNYNVEIKVLQVHENLRASHMTNWAIKLRWSSNEFLQWLQSPKAVGRLLSAFQDGSMAQAL